MPATKRTKWVLSGEHMTDVEAYLDDDGDLWVKQEGDAVCIRKDEIAGFVDTLQCLAEEARGGK